MSQRDLFAEHREQEQEVARQRMQEDQEMRLHEERHLTADHDMARADYQRPEHEHHRHRDKDDDRWERSR